MDKDVKAGKERLLRICVITYPFALSKITRVYNLLFNLLEILESIADKLYVITGNIPANEIPNNRKYHIINFKMEKELRRHLPMYIAFPIWLFNYIMGQIKMSYNLLKISKNIDIVIFFLGSVSCSWIVLLAKVIGKKVVIIASESSSKYATKRHSPIVVYLFRIFEKINYTFSDNIIVYTKDIVHQLELEKYKNKILYKGSRFVDINSFSVKDNVAKRGNIIGYFGRISEEKGVINFIKAIPSILKKQNDAIFLIGGDGPLMGTIKKELRNSNLSDKVILVGWIHHGKLPEYLNELKLLVVPSYAGETGPQIALEAMACGTPVLATLVGSMPNVIKIGETGFILEDNSPECIAKNVIKVLEDPNLEETTKNARDIIEKRYSYNNAVKRYRKILERIMKGRNS